MTSEVTLTPLASFRNATPYPFCPGCGHGVILDQLNAGLGRLALDPRRVVIVSDIGCSGLSDQYFDTQAFHGLHGRSLTYATGLKLARPELTVIVVMGDGGTGIGGAHLLAAARRNLDLTVLVFNNFNFGMTGGQHSATTPAGALTSTTPGGNLERPLDLCATVAAAGASRVYRGTSFDADLGERIAEAIGHSGFAFVDVWEPCTAYFAPRNRLNRKAITELVGQLGFATGLLQSREVAEYGAACRAAARAPDLEKAATATGAGMRPQPIAARFVSRLERPFRLVLAGAAGGRVGTAARLLSRAAVASGLFAAQRNDYPVTVKTGYSLAELVLSPEPIDDAAADAADALLVLAPEGRRLAAGYATALAPGGRVFRLAGVEALGCGPDAERIDPAAAPQRLAKDLVATVATAAVAIGFELVPPAALRAAARFDGEAAELDAALDAAEVLAASVTSSPPAARAATP